MEAQELKKIVSKVGLRPSKSRGQNFLVDQNIVGKIVKAAGVGKRDVVLEVGPGFGVLTAELIKAAGQVVAVEVDKKAADFLRASFGKKDNFSLVEGDILRFDPRKNGLKPFGYKIVANLPYNITSNFLRVFLGGEVKPREMVLMVQKEVAQRIIAGKGKESLLSLSVWFYGQPEILFEVGKSCFWPQPKIDSAVIRISLNKKLPTTDEAFFFRILRVAFAAKRKQLHNNLASGFHIKNAKIKEILTNFGLREDIRPQDLTLDNWLELAKKIKAQL